MKVDAAWHLVHFWFSRHWLGMQARQSASLHRPIAFGFWLLSTCAVAAACSDDGNLLGSENSAGSGGAQSGAGATAGAAVAAGTGGSASEAGSSSQAGHAGTPSAGGAAGTAGAGGSAGAGGTAACDFGQCVRPNVCLDECGGTEVYTGCCPCPANTVEQLSCDGAGGAGGGGDCVGEACAANETCVAHRTVGGAIMPPDQNNQCMAGKHLEGNNCQADFTYSCATLTGCSAPSATCRCAAGTECAGTTACRLPAASAWLDTDAQLVCELLAP